ncbi:MAG: hypothetical protein AAF717_08680 [Bacteroidota bacterium]
MTKGERLPFSLRLTKMEKLSVLKRVDVSPDTECFRIMNLLRELQPYKKDGENA